MSSGMVDMAPQVPLKSNRCFWFILSGTAISTVGDGFHSVALSIWVLTSTGSATAMSAVLVTKMLVGVLLGAVSGTVADRVDRRRLMWMLDLVHAALVCVIMFLMSIRAPLVLVLIVTGLLAAARQFRSPAFSASLVHIVTEEHLSRASGVLQVTNTVARVLGPLLGGSVTAALGGPTALAVDAMSFLASALLVLVAGSFPSPNSTRMERSSFWRDMQDGLIYLRKNSLVATITWFAMCVNFFGYTAMLLVPVIAIKNWNAQPFEFGVLEAFFPLGFTLGAVCIMVLGNRLRRRWAWMGGATSMAGLLLGAVVFMTETLRALPIVLLMGLVIAFVSILSTVAIQTRVDSSIQGRVFGTLDSLVNIATPLAMTVAGVWADRVGAPIILLGVGIGMLVVGGMSLALPGLRPFD